jgi:uncharacterized membrane protein
MRKQVAAAVGLFSLSLIFLWRARPDGDIVEFSRYGHAVLDGQVPYRDFALEYPPGAIAVFTPPALGEYVTWFRVETALTWIVVIALTGMLLARVRPDDRWNMLRLAAVALTPLILGPFALMRFDGLPTALVLAAFLCLLVQRATLALALLAVAIVVKAWPLALLPLFLVYGVPKRALIVFASVLVLALAPFAVVSPGGAYNGLRVQPDRHLEYETLGASALFALHRPVSLYFETGSYSVSGSGANAIANLQSALQLAAVAAIAFVFARSRRGPDELIAAAAATVAAVAVLGKVLSPQFLLWIAPFAAIADLTALALFLAACACTRGLFLGSFRSLVELRSGSVALLTVRNVLLVGTVAALARASWATR